MAERAALITGGTGGIGLAAVAAFLDHGFDVVATGTTESSLATLADRFPDRPGLTLRRVDVTQDTDVETLVQHLDGIDALINCAGVAFGDGQEFRPDSFSRVLEINLVGTLRMCAACRPLLARSDAPSIVNIASMLSVFGSAAVPGYSASKGGVVQLTKSLAIAWAGDGIRVNAVAPGWIETPLNESARQSADRYETVRARTPMGRWGQPEDVAGPMVFLCSPAAGFVTGTVLTVDGGYSAV